MSVHTWSSLRTIPNSGAMSASVGALRGRRSLCDGAHVFSLLLEQVAHDIHFIVWQNMWLVCEFTDATAQMRIKVDSRGT